MRLLGLSSLVLALAACHHDQRRAPSGDHEPSMAADGIKGVHRERKGHPLPDAAFEDAQGRPLKLAQLTGKPMLVNLWATWCAPCVKELPTLDKLAKQGSVSVIAVSQDSAPHSSVLAFLKAHHVSELTPYQDSKMALSGALGPDTVLPTSILVGADGKEVWRYVGDLDWMSPEASKLLSEARASTKQD